MRLKELTAAMFFIFIFGAMGLLLQDPSPHPYYMALVGGLYLSARITWIVMTAVFNYLIKKGENYDGYEERY